jgi:hypothetical protein
MDLEQREKLERSVDTSEFRKGYQRITYLSKDENVSAGVVLAPVQLGCVSEADRC